MGTRPCHCCVVEMKGAADSAGDTATAEAAAGGADDAGTGAPEPDESHIERTLERTRQTARHHAWLRFTYISDARISNICAGAPTSAPTASRTTTRRSRTSSPTPRAPLWLPRCRTPAVTRCVACIWQLSTDEPDRAELVGCVTPIRTTG